jgi:hypothetical protein
MTLSGMRPQLETLIFHGAPPILPPPIDPALPLVREKRPRDEPPLEVHSSELLDGEDDGAYDGDRETPFRARTDRPPALDAGDGSRARRVIATLAAITAAIAIPVAVLVAAHLRGASRALASIGATTVAPNAAPSFAPREPAPLVPAPGACVLGLRTKVLARRAIVRGGVEAAALEDRVAFAALTSPRTAAAFELDATTLDVRGATKLSSDAALRHVIPSLDGDAPIDVVPDTGALRAVPDPEGDSAIGARDGYVVFGPRDGDGMVRLWKLGWGEGIDAARVATLGASGERVVVFRRNGSLWIGSFRGGQTTSELTRLAGNAQRARGEALLVGSPTLDARGDEAVVAWAQRESVGARWGVRWARWTRDGLGVVRDLPIPAGGPGERALAPSVAETGSGRLLLAWTEAGHGRNQVRAQVFDAQDRPLGAAMDVSPSDAMAGQQQIALADASGPGSAEHGAIAYFVARRGAFELRAASIECAP